MKVTHLLFVKRALYPVNVIGEVFTSEECSDFSVESAIGAESRSELEPSSCFERQYEELPVLPTG